MNKDKIIDTIFSGYLNDQFNEFVPEYKMTEKEKNYDKLWSDMTKELSNEERKKYYDLRVDADYERDTITFTDAFKLGLMLGMEVFGNE